MSTFGTAGPRLQGAGVGACLDTEEFGLDQLLRDGGAVDGDECALGLRTDAVQRAANISLPTPLSPCSRTVTWLSAPLTSGPFSIGLVLTGPSRLLKNPLAAPCGVGNGLKMLMYTPVHCAFSPISALSGIHQKLFQQLVSYWIAVLLLDDLESSEKVSCWVCAAR
jgi:hypothetical protein